MEREELINLITIESSAIFILLCVVIWFGIQISNKITGEGLSIHKGVRSKESTPDEGESSESSKSAGE